MGCFSFLCKESGKAALSTSFDGSPCYLFLLKDGVVIEEMYGNYDSYGCVFSGKEDENGVRERFEWAMDWGKVCDLMHSSNPRDGIAMVLEEYFTGEIPTEQSDGDPNQGWGDGEEDPDCFSAQKRISLNVLTTLITKCIILSLKQRMTRWKLKKMILL